MRRFLIPVGLTVIMVGGLGACGKTSGVGPSELLCDNGVDDDGDGYTDCADADCALDPVCAGFTESSCDNGVDDDGDGATDCADTDCANDPACVASGDTCGDLLFCVQGCSDATCLGDCEAAGCPSARVLYGEVQDCLLGNCLSECGGGGGPGCLSCMSTSCATELGDCTADTCQGLTTEVDCSDGNDDDGDGDIDCADSDCAADPDCTGGPSDCGDILDCARGCGGNLGCVNACQAEGCASAQAAYAAFQTCLLTNCLGDCQDPQSAACQGCVTTSCATELGDCTADTCAGQFEANCSDGLDDDSDGAIDCADSDCATDPACAGQIETDCSDGLDDDNDGAIDCADSDCAGDPACGGGPTTCGDVLACVQGCGGDLTCTNACVATGCGTAQTRFNAVQDCLVTNCAVECLGDPGGAQCQTCLGASCAAESAACLADTCAGGGTETNCANSIDDDADGQVDCADADCVADAACQNQVETNCTDGIDDEGDGAVDCADSDCAADQACVATGETCADVLACTQGCAGDLGCLSACQANACASAQTAYADVQSCLVTNCLVDCSADPTAAACQTCLATNCNAELGACLADDCTGAGGSETACGDGVDNDADGQVDCADPDCVADAACAGQVETNCSDGLDDDADGPIDCADADCAADAACSLGDPCGVVLSCTQACGLDFACIGACRTAGCPVGQALYDDMQGCLIGNCAIACALGPGSPQCLGCLQTNCAPELSACISDTCQPIGNETNCSDGQDDDFDGAVDCVDVDCATDAACQTALEADCGDGADNDGDNATDCADSDCAGSTFCGGPGFTCPAISSCVQGCAGAAFCISDCESNGCAAARTAYTDLQTCSQANCQNQCASDPTAQRCVNCRNQNCATESSACSSSTCP